VIKRHDNVVTGSAVHYLRARSESGTTVVLARAGQRTVVIGDVIGVPNLDMEPFIAASLIETSWRRIGDEVEEALGLEDSWTEQPFEIISPVSLGAEVWAAGVTYERSREARLEESGFDIYDRVHSAPRPELFLKADAARTSGTLDPIGIRTDSSWQVPEPEIVLLLNQRLDVVGYSLGNDVTARDIEAANPLYLPQAKIWPNSCAIGPGFVPATAPIDVRQFSISCEIIRSGHVLWSDAIEFTKMVRRFDELVSYLRPMTTGLSAVWLMTGTGLVPPDDIGLRSGDLVLVSVPEIGRLENHVVALPDGSPTPEPLDA